MKNSSYKLFIALSIVVITSCKKSDSGGGTTPPVTQTDIASVDSKVTSWMTTYAMPGASIALTKNGKLVYRKGYGNADNATSEKVTINSKFRVASVSKTFTGVAILKLVQGGLLSLNQKVFGAGSILGTTYGTQPYKPFVTDITVEHLLKHLTGGWGTNAPGDPAFYDSSMSHTVLINWTLDNNLLVSAPGTTYRYSNFNYILLARIIEKVTGKSYEAYLKDEIFTPLGATNTFLAGNNSATKKPNEVTYYGQGGDAPFVYTLYNYNRADGAFGWVSTPTDMLRFATAVDSATTRPDILNSTSLGLMRIGSTANPNYGCGWAIDGPEWYWFGSLPGTASLIYRNSNGICVSFVANSRLQPSPNNALNAMGAFVTTIVNDNTIAWQDIDQF
jgi:CubicO group peptidase (beta-lactamase class C family)